MKNKEKISSTDGTYKNKAQGFEENNEPIIENNTPTTPNKNNSFSLKSAFSTLRRRNSKNKEVSRPDVIDDSNITHDSMKERSRLLTPAEEISAIDPALKNILLLWNYRNLSILRLRLLQSWLFR